MCKVTNEMVVRANEKFVKRMKEAGRRREQITSSEELIVPVKVFGLSVNHRIPIRRVNEIYNEALKKAKTAYGEKI